MRHRRKLSDSVRRWLWRRSAEGQAYANGQRVHAELRESLKPNPDFPRALRHRDR